MQALLYPVVGVNRHMYICVCVCVIMSLKSRKSPGLLQESIKPTGHAKLLCYNGDFLAFSYWCNIFLGCVARQCAKVHDKLVSPAGSKYMVRSRL